MKHKTISIKQALFAAACFVFLACEKDLGSLGLNQVVDSKGQFQFLDTLPVITYTQKFDSIRTDIANRALLGNQQDIVFGGAKSSFVTEILPEAFRPQFPEDAIFDSVELALPYLNFVGDTNVPMTVRVYRLNERLFADSSYYSNRLPEKGDLLGELSVQPRPRTRVRRGLDTLSSLMIIPLNKALIEQLIWDEASETNPNFQNENSFREYFNGIVVEADGGNSIIGFNPYSTSLSMRLFYRNSSTDTLQRAFNITGRPNQANKFYNYFELDFSSSSINFDQQDTVLGMKQTYVMGLAGAYTVLEIPDLGPLLDSGVLIHRMDIELNMKPGSTARQRAPQNLIMFDLNTENLLNSRDFRLGFTQNNGVFTATEFRNAKYSFSLTLQVMDDIIKKREKVKLGIVPAQRRGDFLVPAGNSSADRLILSGNLDNENPYSIKIFYSKP